MMLQGTVAVEIKSGYGLTTESELKMLRVARRLADALPLQVRTSLLAAHALPPEFADDRSAYVDLIVNELIPQVKKEGLADFVDTFCETNYFTVAEMKRSFFSRCCTWLARKSPREPVHQYWRNTGRCKAQCLER